MAFFGVMMGLLGATAVVSESFKSHAETSHNKAEAERKGELYYYDYKGRRRYIVDDRLVGLHSKEKYGISHYVLYCLKTGTILHDYTMEEKKQAEAKSKEIALKYGITVYEVYDPYIMHKYGLNVKLEHLYKDIKTGELYVCKMTELPSRYPFWFFVNIKTNKIVRPSDDEIARWIDIKYLDNKLKRKIQLKEMQEFIEKEKNPMGIKSCSCVSLAMNLSYGIAKGKFFEEKEEDINEKMTYIKRAGVYNLNCFGDTWDEIKKHFES